LSTRGVTTGDFRNWAPGPLGAFFIGPHSRERELSPGLGAKKRGGIPIVCEIGAPEKGGGVVSALNVGGKFWGEKNPGSGLGGKAICGPKQGSAHRGGVPAPTGGWAPEKTPAASPKGGGPGGGGGTPPINI